MSYKNYLEKINKRNANLVAYHLRHPHMRQEKLALIFKISQSRISRILTRAENKKGGKNQC